MALSPTMQYDFIYGPYDLANEHLKDYFYYSLQQPKCEPQNPTILIILQYIIMTPTSNVLPY